MVQAFANPISSAIGGDPPQEGGGGGGEKSSIGITNILFHWPPVCEAVSISELVDGPGLVQVRSMGLLHRQRRHLSVKLASAISWSRMWLFGLME